MKASFVNQYFCSHMGETAQWLALSPHSKKVLGSILGSACFCAKFAFSACVDSLRVERTVNCRENCGFLPQSKIMQAGDRLNGHFKFSLSVDGLLLYISPPVIPTEGASPFPQCTILQGYLETNSIVLDLYSAFLVIVDHIVDQVL